MQLTLWQLGWSLRYSNSLRAQNWLYHKGRCCVCLLWSGGALSSCLYFLHYSYHLPWAQVAGHYLMMTWITDIRLFESELWVYYPERFLNIAGSSRMTRAHWCCCFKRHLWCHGLQTATPTARCCFVWGVGEQCEAVGEMWVLRYVVRLKRKSLKILWLFTGREEDTEQKKIILLQVFIWQHGKAAVHRVYKPEPFFKSVFQDRLTFRRIIVKNNAKKRRLYEAFIETLPLLTSLEVNISFVRRQRKCSMLLQWNPFFYKISSHPQLSERMKVVDVISSKVYSDSQQIIAQVMNLLLWSAERPIFLYSAAATH